jgi:acyl carrier protein
MNAVHTLTEAQYKQIILTHLAQIAPEANLDELSPDENVRDALDIDSFDHLNFLIALHEELGIEIPEAGYGQLNTVNGIDRYLSARVH